MIAFPRKIMVVDDAEDILLTVRMILTRLGFEVETYINGLEALHGLEQGSMPDLILLDLMMPVMNGWEFLETIATIPDFRNIPVVVISALSSKEAIEHQQVREVLTKPLPLAKLKEITDRYAH